MTLGNTGPGGLECALCRAPDGLSIWRLPKSGKWTDGSRVYDKTGVEILHWRNRHGVTCKGAVNVKNAQTVTVKLKIGGELILCGWCRGRAVEQREMVLDV